MADAAASVNLSQAFVTLIASGIGTLVAGYVGVTFALRKLKRERAFDRSLEWYEEITRAVVRMHSVIFDLQQAKTVTGELVASVNSARDELFAVMPLAELYAGPEAAHLCREAVSKFSQMSRSWKPEELDRAFTEVTTVLVNLRTELIREARRHLGSDPIPPMSNRVRTEAL